MNLFISYAYPDKQRVENQLIRVLRSGGHTPHYDLNLVVGKNWQQALFEAIGRSDAFIYVISPASVESEWCQWEYASAVRLGKPIIPVMIRNTKKMPNDLAQVQYVDITKGATGQATARLLNGLNTVATILGGQLTDMADASIVAGNISSIPTAPTFPIGMPAHAIGKKSSLGLNDELPWWRTLWGIASILTLLFLVIGLGMVVLSSNIFETPTPSALGQNPTATSIRPSETVPPSPLPSRTPSPEATLPPTAEIAVVESPVVFPSVTPIPTTEAPTQPPTREESATPSSTATITASADGSARVELRVLEAGVNLRNLPYGPSQSVRVDFAGNGKIIPILGRNEDGDWYWVEWLSQQLWIYDSGIGFELLVDGDVVDNATADRFIPVVATPPPPN